LETIGRWLAAFGYRSVAYVVFVALLFPFAMLLEAAGPHGPDSGGGGMTALVLWALVSLVFFAVNLVLVIVALAKGRSPQRPLIACALPVLCVAAPLITEPFFMALRRG
jgi:hypothetical protein